MTATPETYERAINALARQNDALIRENRRLKERVAELIQGQLDELQDRSRMVEALRERGRN